MKKLKISELLLPFLVWSLWIVFFTAEPRWHLFAENWFMPITMAIGSFIAGSTSEGGGAVAFPMMTLLFQVKPTVARDFSLMIQSVGMTSAAIAIVINRIAIEPCGILFPSLGGLIGMGIGLEVVSPHLQPTMTKIFFITLWFSFGIALLWINRDRHRQTWQRIPNFKLYDALTLTIVGVIGGIVSGITGSGLDILTFSLLVLAFRLDEKVATPTSVILMALNSIVGFIWRFHSINPIASDTWNYWCVCIPVVVVGAPLGARFIAQRSKVFVVRLLLSLIVIQFMTALFILPLTFGVVMFAVFTFGFGVLLFSTMIYLGHQRLFHIQTRTTPKKYVSQAKSYKI